MKNRFFTPLFLITFLFSSLILFSVSSKAAATGCLKNSDGTAIMVTAGDATPFAFAGTTTYNIDACSQEPDEYKIKFFKVALCTAEPYTTGGGTAPDFTSCTDLSNTEKEVTLEPGVDKDLIDGELVLPLGSYKYLVVIIDNHLKIKHQQKYVLASDGTSPATIYGNSSGSGQFCWTVAAGITTYTGETYDSDYATAQGVTPVASGEGTTNARLKCGSSVSGKGFATEIIDHFGEDATFVGFMNYGELDVATDTGISGIELAGNMLQADNTIATNEDHSRRIAQIYRYATPVVITENTNSFKLKVTTYSSVSIDMATDANASHRIYGAKVGGDPFIIEVETGTAE
ncbi:hypothetical protein N9N44_03645 [Candidatus Pelagibacter bacterium]|nr:hypothetical protein [Candidatus Pelagibacter bacterium]MDA7444745.1 hypothetical protein [Candidatus Pelagibacter ubique]MDC3274493.1 hypothetical protein [bacterium]MDA7453685.1 hypothetical protein [Candidatus Pelagibacter ubique]MDA7469454.1 hypothetical protein [Candidatus Pelagibacter ubique]MDA7487141.1 hypothetical protein [Candidatus Pelagibacter ubique]